MSFTRFVTNGVNIDIKHTTKVDMMVSKEKTSFCVNYVFKTRCKQY